MKEKMRKVRYPMLIVWGIFMGAAGTAGVKSSWHVIPGWLIGVIVILGIMVMLTWMISGKNDKSIKTPEKETEKLTLYQINIKVQFRNFRYFKSSRRACGVGILGKTKWY